jgi:hypothetical protein
VALSGTMMKPTRWRKWLYVLLALALVFASSTLHEGLLTMRDAWSWRPAVENFPPSLVLGTQMLGSFRGMLVVALWLRATTLQDQGRYYELVQLFNWITELEPRIETVWAYAAWNQSYNISVAFPADQPEERWRWVMNGIKLLRDRGLVINPRSYVLNRELAWLYFHKVGGTTDEAHLYYKQQFARLLHVILGGPTPDYARLAAAPKTEDKLLSDEAVRSLVEKARAAGLRVLGTDIEWLNDPTLLPEAVKPVFDAARETPAYDTLDAFLRARALREQWRIDPAYAKQLVDKYGPLDFRQPEAHAVYWGAKSLEHVKPTENRIHGERMVYQPLVRIFQLGRLNYDPKKGMMWWSPDVRFADSVRKVFLEKFEVLEPEYREIGRESAYKNWMRNAITILYEYGAKNKAEEFLKALDEFDPRPEYKVPIEDFVIREAAQDIDQGQYQQVTAYIEGYIARYLYYLALGEQEVAQAHLAMAQHTYARFMAKAPARLQGQLGTWEALKKEILDNVLDPQRGFDKLIRDLLREALGLPPEEEPKPETEETG